MRSMFNRPIGLSLSKSMLYMAGFLFLAGVGHQCALARPVYQQETGVQEGRVTDVDGNPLPGVEVRVAGSPVVTPTNQEGVFSIKEIGRAHV